MLYLLPWNLSESRPNQKVTVRAVGDDAGLRPGEEMKNEQIGHLHQVQPGFPFSIQLYMKRADLMMFALSLPISGAGGCGGLVPWQRIQMIWHH
jgi:hypothetical protein